MIAKSIVDIAKKKVKLNKIDEKLISLGSIVMSQFRKFKFNYKFNNYVQVRSNKLLF